MNRNTIREKNRRQLNVRTAIALDFFGVIIPNMRCVAQRLAAHYKVSNSLIVDKVFENEGYKVLQVGDTNASDLLALVEMVVGEKLAIEDVVGFWSSEVPAPTPAATAFLDWCRLEFDLVFLVSDMHEVHYQCAKLAGWLTWFDAVITSFKVRSLKVSGVAYQHCVKLLPNGPWQLVAVDDRQENLLAAREFGFHPILEVYDGSFAELQTRLIGWQKGIAMGRYITAGHGRSVSEDAYGNV